ncbi:MAG: hypothetical protein J6Y78_12990 [Paludibacteraceae bacterium]|nr:hypothetical protein [Paludibacteraceae bacterium]
MTLIRLPNFDRKDYLHQKRIAVIQKAHLPLQIRLQRIMNQAIDEKVLSMYDEVDEDIQTGYTAPAYKEEILLAEIGRQNLLATQQDMNRLLNRSIVTQNHITNLEKYNASKQISDRITKIEVEQINKNIKYIEKTLEEAELDIAKYKNLVKKLPKQVSRQEMLQKALVKGSNYKGREYTYKELRRLSMDLERYKTANLDYQKGMIENRQANREGLPTPNTTKTWIWSTLERTRHEGMDGQTVRFGEKFEVTNEVTGVVDMLRFPADIENDHNNCANICNCACSYEIN